MIGILAVCLGDIVGIRMFFLDGFKFFSNADSDRGYCPDGRGVADWCGFFLFLGFGVAR